MELNLIKARARAKLLGLNWQSLSKSPRAGKRFMIQHENAFIHFGAWPAKTFLDHQDSQIRDAWRARHSKIMKQGKPAYLDKTSPEFYSWNILW